MNTKEYKIKMNALLSDPLFIKANKYNESRLLMELCPITETDISSLINWYADPKEAHGLGSLFLRSLLVQISSPEDGLRYFNNGKEYFKNHDELLKLNFSCVFSSTEFVLDNKRRIDNLIYIPCENMVVVIELKYGAKEHNKQCLEYKQKIDKIYPDKDIVYIFWDLINDEEDLSSDAWSFIDSNWLTKFMTNHFETTVDDDVKYILKNYIVELEGNYRLDMKYSEALDAIGVLAEKHSEIVEYIKPKITQMKKMNIIDVIDIDDETYPDLGLYYKLNEIVFDHILLHSKFDKIEKYLRRKTIDFDGRYVVDQVNDNEWAITLNHVDQLTHEDMRWPYSFSVIHKPEKTKLSFYFDHRNVEKSETIPDEIKDYFRDELGSIVKKNSKKLHFTLCELNEVDGMVIGDKILDFQKNHKRLFEMLFMVIS